MIRPILARLLGLANAAPPYVFRDEFYAMKSRILERWATPDGYDIQHIAYPCWTCNGRGEFRRSGACCKCGGTGVHHEVWVCLKRWKLGGRVFHIPQERVTEPPSNPVTIEGHITHATPPGNRAFESTLWLALCFDRRLFLRMLIFRYLSGGAMVGWPILTPMALLHWCVSGLVTLFLDLRQWWRRRDNEIPF